jgi:hypothetical protein
MPERQRPTHGISCKDWVFTPAEQADRRIVAIPNKPASISPCVGAMLRPSSIYLLLEAK